MKYILTIATHACHCEGQSPEAISEKVPQSLLWQTMLAVCVSFFAMMLFLPSVGFTESKEIISEGTYNMGDGETPSVAESRALLQAKRTALEEAGTYVESYSKVINLQLTEDEIQVLAAGLMEVTILDKKRTIVGDGFHFWVKIKARVNLDKTEELANRIKAKDKSFVEDYKRIQEAYDNSQKEIEGLKKELSQAKGEKEKKQVEAKIAHAERWLQINEWVEKGNQYSLKKEYDNAIENYNKAIVLNPDDAYIYTRRGIAYYDKGQYDKAIEDFSKAIALNPNDDSAYSYRGMAYHKQGQYTKESEDYKRANALIESSGFSFYDRDIEKYSQVITLNPKDAKAYTKRGNAYLIKRQYDRAIEDLNKAITLDPNYDRAYYIRGRSYNDKGQYDRAIADYTKAIALHPNSAVAYYYRGVAYRIKRQYDRAIADFNKTIALEPIFAFAYYQRGIAYNDKGQHDRAISDFQKACDLGDEDGCKGLKMVLEDR